MSKDELHWVAVSQVPHMVRHHQRWGVRLENRSSRSAFYEVVSNPGMVERCAIRYGRLGAQGRTIPNQRWDTACTKLRSKLDADYEYADRSTIPHEAERLTPGQRPLEDRIAGASFRPVELRDVLRRIARDGWSMPCELPVELGHRLWPSGTCQALNVYTAEGTGDVWAVARFIDGKRLLAMVKD